MAEGNDGATPRATLEFAKCAVECAYFIDNYLIIDDTQGTSPDGGGTGVIAFKLWPAQLGVVWTLMQERQVIILKARQLGISWICCAYALWHCLFQPHKLALLYSQGQDEANELLRRVKSLYDRLPGWLREVCPKPVQENTTLIEWSNGSRIKSLPATQKAGRSLTASLVVLDEAAHLQWGEQLYTALKPTVDGGGQLIVLSTANGIGNLFHNLWTRAVAGANGFRTIFLPWWARPGRDQAWYDARAAEETDPSRVKQEYPASSSESFLVSGRVRFEPTWIEAQVIHVRSGLANAFLPAPLRSIPGLAVYELPDQPRNPARKIVIGADVSEGLEHRDYSDATVIDARTWVELASLHGHWEPDVFADYLATLGECYGATIAVERNNHGHAVLATLKRKNFARIGSGLDGRPGWLTNVQSKPQMIDLLATALRDNLIQVRTQAALDEMRIYRVNADGSTSAPNSYFDDRVMSRAIALMFSRSMAVSQGPAIVGGKRDAAKLVIR
jgi:hypothetical protein